MPTNPIMQYQEQAINTMSKGELLIKLYDEVLKNINYASILLKQEDYPMAEQYCDKSKNIFNYLSITILIMVLYNFHRTVNPLAQSSTKPLH